MNPVRVVKFIAGDAARVRTALRTRNFPPHFPPQDSNVQDDGWVRTQSIHPPRRRLDEVERNDLRRVHLVAKRL